MRKNLVIDSRMKELWPAVRVGCLQYQVQVERKNPELWAYLKKEIYKKAKDAIFDYGVNERSLISKSPGRLIRRSGRIPAVTGCPRRR